MYIFDFLVSFEKGILALSSFGQKTLLGLKKNIEALVQLPIDQLDVLSLKKAIQDIHDE